MSDKSQSQQGTQNIVDKNLHRDNQSCGHEHREDGNQGQGISDTSLDNTRQYVKQGVSHCIHPRNNRSQPSEGQTRPRKRQYQKINEGYQRSRKETQCKNPKTLFCNYCGDDTLTEEDLSTTRVCHKDCIRQYPRREKAAEIFKTYFAKCDNVLSIAINVTFLYGQVGDTKDPNKRTKRSYKLHELTKIVSALRNSNSGYVLIHLVGLAPADSYIGSFDEFADQKLHDLINDGSSFDDVYEKKLLSDYKLTEDLDELNEKLREFSDFLVLYVEGSNYLFTVDFKTKSALDDRIIDSSALSLFRFLNNRRDFKEDFPPCSTDILSLKESKSVQLKAYIPNTDWTGSTVSYMFEHKLVDNVSAFSKNKAGGAYYLGVAERKKTFPGTNYKSKTVSVTPVSVENQEHMERDLKQKLENTVLVCDYDGQELNDANIVKIKFLSMPSEANFLRHDQTETEGNFVICVPVRPVRGIVFCDQEGPLAYRVGKDHNSISKLELKEWFRVFMQQPYNF